MQSGLGSPNTSAPKFRFAKYLSGADFNVDLQVTDVREGGDGLDFGFTYKQVQAVRGAIQVAARPDIAGQLLMFVPGFASWAGASSPAIHQFHTNHASFPYATLQIGYPGTTMITQISDARFTGLTIAGGGQDKRILLTMPFVGLTHGASAPFLVPTYIAEAPFLYHSTPTYLLDGAAATTLESWQFEMQFGTDELQSQAVTLDDIAFMNRDTNVQIVRRFEDTNLWRKIYYGAAANIAPTSNVATGSLDVMVGYGNPVQSMRVVAPLITYRGDALTSLDPDGQTVRETITAKALKNASAALFVTLQNAHASQYVS